MTVDVANANLIALLLVSLRVLGWALVAPPLATSGVPLTVKTILSVALALTLTPGQVTHVPALEAVPVVVSGITQFVIGAALGFLTRLTFAALESAGSLIDLSGGFALSQGYDPLMLTNTSIFARFHALLGSVLLFVTPAHLYLFIGFSRTFDTVPLDGHFSTAALGEQLTKGLTNMFVATLQIAGPILLVMFLADVTLGLMSRIAPAMNVFALGFPFKIGLTLTLLGFTFLLLPDVVQRFTTEVVQAFEAVT